MYTSFDLRKWLNVVFIACDYDNNILAKYRNRPVYRGWLGKHGP